MEAWQDKYERYLHLFANKIRLVKCRLVRTSIGEFFGTLILIYFGAGVVAQSRFVANTTAISITLGWGMAVLFALFISGTMGYGLINPALTLAFALIGQVEWVVVPVFTVAQIAGAYIGALVVFLVYRENIYGLDSQGLLMNSTGTIFVTAPSEGNRAALIDQIIGTAVLAALCCAIADPHNLKIPKYMAQLYIAFVVYALVGAFGTNAGAALNPARDLGPRLALLTVGYHDAFTTSDYYFWVPIVGPYVGAPIGAVLYELTIGIHLKGLTEKEALRQIQHGDV